MSSNAEKNYPGVFSTLNVGQIELHNRIVFPAWQVNYAKTDGTVSNKLLDFYTAIADGGCGIIFTGPAVVSSDSVAFDRVMRIDSEQCIPGLKKLFYEIEKRGSVPAMQLIHPTCFLCVVATATYYFSTFFVKSKPPILKFMHDFRILGFIRVSEMQGGDCCLRSGSG